MWNEASRSLGKPDLAVLINYKFFEFSLVVSLDFTSFNFLDIEEAYESYCVDKA